MWNENCWKQIKIWHDNYLNSIVSSPRSFKHAGYDYMSPYDFYSIVSHKMMKQNGRNQDPTFREVGSEYHVFKIILISCHNYLWELRSFLFFLQKTCACGNHGDSKVIVQFYEELENGILDPYCKPPLKTPLCLGALISQKHVLTVKSCFGAKPNEESINEVKVKYSHWWLIHILLFILF